MPTVLITGANRGIGLGLCKEFSRLGYEVIAACRNPESATALKDVTENILSLDINDEKSVASFTTELSGKPIDILINNAGAYGRRNQVLGQISSSEWLEILQTNAVSPILLTRALLPNLRLGQLKKISFISSKMGSITDNGSGEGYIYRTSKCALNCAVKSLSIDLRDDGITVLSLHPGWVQTDMGGPNGLINVDRSVAGLAEVVTSSNLESSGGFFNYDGAGIEW